MARRRRRRSRKSFGSISIKTCPREGTRVQFNPHPVSRRLYSRPIPYAGEVGTIVTVPIPGGRKTCMRGPGGGLVYVKWPSIGTMGVSSIDLDKVRR